MERALKYTLLTLLAIVLVALGFVYGLYFAGARHISPDWRPTAARYPESARLALWRSYGGQDSPEGNPMSPPEYAWRWYQSGRALMAHRTVDPAMTMAYRAARIARFATADQSPGNTHLIDAAATIRASQWPVESQLDTVLDNAWFGDGARGFRQGAVHVFGTPLERLNAAQLHVLVTMEWAPTFLDPWCHRDRLRERALTTAARWQVAASPQQLEAALAAIAPAAHPCIADHR